MSDTKGRVKREYEKNLDLVTGLSHRINANPELAFEEYETSAAIVAALESGGEFTVEKGVADLTTAFVASAGSGDLVFGVCAEMDALPGIGHGCGHNVIAASAVGAALALAPFADELGLTVRVFGTPAEESGTGKEIMVNRGVFDGTHAAIMVHPSLKDVVTPQLRASRSWRITYTGRGGHASRPWSALNAADATVVAQTAIGLLRQQLRDGIRVHHVVKEAGSAVNVIADHAVVDCMIRCDTIDEVDEVWERVRRCFDAGAIATGAGVEFTSLPSIYREFRHDQDLAPVFESNAKAIGRTFPDYPDKMFGSTDMGNVSLRIPALHPMLSFDLPTEEGNHTAAFAAAAAGPDGDRFVHDAGLAMALTIAEVAQSEPIRAGLIARAANG
ncbi:M20 family metallopeptidase [Streptomyces rapamycinicus]|uniref:Peptidase M20 domain-containing protein 2 n=2 Tax=Streptomyces rapamycinicus TaxID=1226757 RepID=A0A0A0NQR6_STRRN|nr:M20 family metallopeptidase [Streptomyces rapamycinicus]AGP59606.1 amidohydrolase [Streptomyces rapamycinicus NRRL 5491]MBB4789242.1 amidohydrolase [Streptomyces rapamycinicus]RLV77211.1 amidohydrolase [Streptomyces rapamycinicus NRRL 5491]UTO67303.1 M20 family metallopeptidase [Streptomyces rapamycinicus]UTP35260.1 M20 family metallopeptidase [Streptomyces rapamycinicus NRRL 5491]